MRVHGGPLCVFVIALLTLYHAVHAQTLLQWTPVAPSNPTVARGAGFIVSMLNLKGLYSRNLNLDGIVSAVESNGTPKRYSMVVTVDEMGQKPTLALETYQDSLNNYKLIMPSALKNLKQGPSESYSMQSNLWFEVDSSAALVSEGTQAFLRNQKLFNGKTDFTLFKVYHAESMKRQLSMELQLLQSRISDSDNRVAAANAEVQRLKGQQLTLVLRLEQALQSTTDPNKRTTVDALDFQVKDLDSKIKAQEEASRRAAALKDAIVAVLPSLNAEIAEEVAQVQSGSLDPSMRNYVYAVVALRSPMMVVEKMHACMYKDGNGVWHVMGSSAWTH